MTLNLIQLKIINKKSQKINYSTLQSIFKTAFTQSFPKTPWEDANLSFNCSLAFGKIIKEGTEFNIMLSLNRLSEAERDLYLNTLIDLDKEEFNSRFYKIKECRKESIIIDKNDLLSDSAEICLKLLTPLHINKKNKTLDKSAFASAVENRINFLFDTQVSIHKEKFEIIPYLNYVEIQERTTSSNTNQKLNGFMGKIFIKGDFSELLCWLRILEYTGFNRSYGLGTFTLLDDESFFELSDEIMSNSVDEFLDQYDYFAFMDKDMPVPFEKDIFLEDIKNSVEKGSYSFSPTNSSEIRQEEKTRTIEVQNFRDAYMSKALLKTIQKPFESLFLKQSIGFRTGVGREKALEYYRDYISQGFEYLLKIDIKKFFESIDHEILKKVLENFFPHKDKYLANLVLSSVTSPCLVEGEIIKRTKGISTGNSLSPLVSNLYLHGMDVFLNKLENAKFIRFADDLLIFTKSPDDSELILEKVKNYLKRLKLEINEEKLINCHYSQEIKFLGYTLPETEQKDNLLPYKKPLYILDPYIYLALSGKTINVYKNYKLVQSIPISRVKELILMNKTVLSTSLIKILNDENIPVMLTSDTGYHLSSISSNKKKTMEFAFSHANWYYNLEKNAKVEIAKELLNSKVERYLKFLQAKYNKENLPTIHLFKSSLEEINYIGEIEILRGKEGYLAKLWWKCFNRYLGNTKFHMKKREKSSLDYINSMLNFGYYLLFNKINALLVAEGFNPYLGILHSHLNDYESFTCDVQEVFRAEIDRIVIKMVNLGIIKESSFAQAKSGYYLKHEYKLKFIEEFEKEWNKKTKKSDISLNDELTIQVYNLKRHVLYGENLKFGLWRYL